MSKILSNRDESGRNPLEHIMKLARIGTALSAEKNLDRLFEMIVDEAREFTNADGGTLYIMTDDETALRFAIVQTSSLNIRMGGTSGEITWHPINLKNPDGTPNHANVCAHVALSEETVNIADVYHAEGFNFEGTRKFDAGTGYRSKSMLVVPMRNHENDIIGVLQLLNAQDRVTGEVIPFSIECQRLTESLASQAAVALTNNRLIQALENLFEAFIRSIATAIDEKSPYTGGHVRRVAELTMTIAARINDAKDGPYANVSFTDDEMKELRIAAWMHDVGKITTPEYVVDKATKLETIFDRIEVIKTRFEVLKRESKIKSLKEKASWKKDLQFEAIRDSYKNKIKSLKDDFNFLASLNKGKDYLDDDRIKRLQAIARKKLVVDGKVQPLLTEDEIHNLLIRRGTLTDEEREIIKNHAAITFKMLSQLPFPKKLKNVPLYAGAHHERLDGSGYPLGLKGDQLPLQARIIALADVFEALTAKDRPYKKGKTLSEAMKILKSMAKDNHIDPDLFDLFVKEGIYMDYAKKELSPQQIDEVKS